jgi:hypothetical protein
MNRVQSNGRSHQKPLAKGGKGKIHRYSEATTRFPRASCFEKPTRSVSETWRRMYNALARSAKGTRKRDEKLDSRAAEKGVKKSVSSNFTKILEVATKIRETCEKTLFTPPSPIKATNSIVSV